MQRRILLLITDLEIGGTPSVVRELAVRLHDPPGVVVDVACLAGWGPTVEQMRQRNIQVTALGARGPLDFKAIGRLNCLIAERQYDTLFSFLAHANTAAAMMKLFHRDLRIIQSVQTTQPEPRWHWLMQSIVQAAAEKIVVPSESVKMVGMEWADISAEKIIVIPNAVDPSDFPRSGSDSPTPFPIGFIGRLDPIKQVPVLVREFATLSQQRDAVLHIFGDGRDRGRVEAAIADHGLQGKVFLHGTIANPQSGLSQIRLLVLPSAAEGFGLVLIEAMAAGVPVVANRAPGICDVIQDQKTGVLADVSQPAALADAMRRIIDDADLRKRLIANGLVEVAEKYSWGKVLREYRNLLLHRD